MMLGGYQRMGRPVGEDQNSNPAPILLSYADKVSVFPDETIQFMVSSENPEYSVEIVRLIHGDGNQHGPGFKEEVVPTGIAGSYKGKLQAIH
jgi:N,N-dimethylformamidase